PHLFAGTPLAADPQSGWMYLPVMATFALLPVLSAFKALMVGQLVIAGVSTFAFARVLGMGQVAAVVSATVYLFGPLLQCDTYWCMVFAQFASWIPLMLLGVELASRASGWRSRLVPWSLAAIAISQMFAGWVGEGWIYTGLLLAGYAGYRALE